MFGLKPYYERALIITIQMEQKDYLDFLIEVSEAIANNNGDPKVVYPLFQARR